MAARLRLLVGISVVWVPLAFLFDGVTVLMLPLRVGGDVSQLGLVSLVGLGIAAAVQPIAGWASDRVRDRVDRRGFLAVAAVPAVLGVWLLAGTTGVAAALAGYIVIQLGATALQAAQQTLIPEHVDAPTRGRASGLKVAFDVGGAFVAFAALGALLAGGELASGALVVTAVVVGAVALVLVLVPRRLPDTSPPPPQGPNSSVTLPSGLAPIVASRFLFLFGTYAVGRFLVPLVADRLGIDPGRAVDDAGWLLAVFTLVTAAAAIPIGWIADAASRRDLMVSGSLIAATGILLLVPSAGVAGVLGGGLLMSVGTAAFVTANWAATTALVPSSDAGRLMAIANLGTGLAAAAAGILGPLISASGFAPALVVAAVSSAAAIVPVVAMRSTARSLARS